MLQQRLKPEWAAVCATLLSVPGATGFVQPRHLSWYGLERVDIALCAAASGALLLGFALTVTLARGGSGRVRRMAVLAVVLATSGWGLYWWWTSLLAPPFEARGAIF